MKRTQVIMLALMAVFAMSAVAVASASAAEPELINKNKEAVKGNITGKSTAGKKTVLETANGTNVTCESASSTGGESAGTAEPKKETKGTKVTFKGCSESVFKGKCQNTKTSGEIVTNTLHGLIGFVAGSKKGEVGLELTPESGTVFVTFECLGGFAKIEVKGAVIGQLGQGEFNKKTKSLKLNFAKGAKSGSQKITEIEGGTHKPAHLESSLNGGKFEESNQQGEGAVEFAEEAELKA